jgi:hypothetical protein
MSKPSKKPSPSRLKLKKTMLKDLTARIDKVANVKGGPCTQYTRQA